MTFNMYLFQISLFVLILWSSNEANNLENQKANIDEGFLKTISHHYCNRIKGVNVVLLVKNSAASFYNILVRSFVSTFYVHNILNGTFSLSDHNILYIQDEQFFFEEQNYDHTFWSTTKTYLIISENKLNTKIIWPHIRRIWDTFKVFKISLLHLNDLKVLRIFDGRFYNYSTTQKLDYSINNVKGYPLKVALFPRVPNIICTLERCGGTDWEVLQTFTTTKNFTLKLNMFSNTKHFGGFRNGSYYGLLGEVVNGYADISFNSRFLNDPMIEKPYRYTDSYGFDSICFVVPRPKILSNMELLKKMFTYEVWLCILISYAFMTNSFLIFYKFNLFGDQKNFQPFLIGFQILLGMGDFSLPKRVVGRLLFVSCSVAFFVIVSLIQASMVTMLSVEIREKEINTLEELDKSGLEIRSSLSYVKDSLADNPLTKSLADKIDPIKKRQDYAQSKFVFMARITTKVIGSYSNYIGHIGNKTFEFHVVQECPLRHHLAYPVALDFPFLNELNDLLIHLKEAGLFDKWKSDITKKIQDYYKPIGSINTVRLKCYTMDDLRFAFVFLLGGNLLSLIVFVFEFMFIKNNKQNQFVFKLRSNCFKHIE